MEEISKSNLKKRNPNLIANLLEVIIFSYSSGILVFGTKEEDVDDMHKNVMRVAFPSK